MTKEKCPLVLTLSGGGILGYRYTKILPKIQEHFNIVYAYGASIGSLVALATIYNVDLQEVFNSREFKRLFKLYNFNFGIYALSSKQGLYNDFYLMSAIAKVMNLCKLPLDITFKDIPNLCVNACIKGGKMGDNKVVIHFNNTVNNDILLIDALYSSCCIPGIFPMKSYRGYELFDGGMLENMIIPKVKNHIGIPMIGIYLYPIYSGNWIIDTFWTNQGIHLVKRAKEHIPVIMLTEFNYNKIPNHVLQKFFSNVERHYDYLQTRQ